MLCREVGGTNWGPLHCSAGPPELHGSFDMSIWGQYSGGFTPGANGQQTWNLPHPRGGSCPPGGGTGATRGSGSYCSLSRVWKLLNPRNLPSRLLFRVPLPLQNTTMTHPGKQRDPCKGLSPNIHQPWPQISPTTGCGPTSRRVERDMTGVGNSGPLATRVQNPPKTPKSMT